MTDLRKPLEQDIFLRGGDFSVESPLGMGGFGITYRGCDRRLGRIVAIKEFFPYGCKRQNSNLVPGAEWTTDDLNAQRQRFVEEGRTLARLRHPGIPVIYDIFEENATAYLVMEFVQGQTFAQYMEAQNVWCLSADEALGLTQGACEALAVVHRAQLLHRDLKPANLMRCPDGQVMLIDFGASHEFLPETVHSQTVVYTAGYAPLEQYSRSGVHGPYSDVYSLSATLYYLLTGQKPMEAPLRAVGHNLLTPAQINPQISSLLSQAVMNGLELRPDMRPATVEEFLNALLVAKASIDDDPFADLGKGNANDDRTRTADNAKNGVWKRKARQKRPAKSSDDDFSMLAPNAPSAPPLYAPPVAQSPVVQSSVAPPAGAQQFGAPPSAVSYPARPAAVVSPYPHHPSNVASVPHKRPSRFKQFFASGFRIITSAALGAVTGAVVGIFLLGLYEFVPHDVVPYHFINRHFYAGQLASSFIRESVLAFSMGFGLLSYAKQKRLWIETFKSNHPIVPPKKVSALKVIWASLSVGILTCFWGVLLGADFLSSIRDNDVQSFVLPVINLFQVMLTLTVSALAGVISYNKQKQLVDNGLPLPQGAIGVTK